MDAGGLAQMTYKNNNNTNNGYNPSNGGGLNGPAAGFGSRGKGAHIKRLSVAPPSNINSIYEDQVDQNPAPRTSRSHLLAGLRTQPKTPGQVPQSAPYNQTQHPQSYYNRNNGRHEIPQTAMGSYFTGYDNGNGQYGMNAGQQMYSMPEQVLAPPALNFTDVDNDQMDPQTYDELMATKFYLYQRQQQLQQQLVNVTAAAQQFQGMNLNNGYNGNSIYHQQAQIGVQPNIQPLPNQPGVYTVYNPLTGQHSLFMDQSASYMPSDTSPPLAPSSQSSSSPDEPETPVNFSRWESLPQTNKARNTSPPKKAPSPPQDVTPLPPPSANAFRPGHRKSMSSTFGSQSRINLDGLKSAATKTGNFPQTPHTGTFGPGMGRAGEHPTRQPRGPPPLEELVAAPTSKHEGSKNFATRQRRRAVHNLVRAGNERRSGRASDGNTPTSDLEAYFGPASDAESNASGYISGQPSFDNLKAPTNGAIGSERASAHRRGMGSSWGGEDLNQTGNEAERRKSPMFVLTSATEKRKSTVM